MKQASMLKTVLFSALILIIMAVQGSAQPPRGRGIYGDWLVKSDFNGRTFESILSFSRNEKGDMTGAWISFWGLNELKDVNFTDGKLSFTQTWPTRDGGTSTSKFTGTITDGVLSGTMSSDRGDMELKGNRMPRSPRAVGDWQMKYTVGDRAITSTLKIRADAQGHLTAQWPSDHVERTITDLALNRRDLSFKCTTKMGDRQWDSSFTGTLRRNEITGTLKSNRGEITVTGTRLGADLIGTWDLSISSNFGERKQRLRVNPDMTGYYGSILVKAISHEGDKVSFKVVSQFGDRTFEMDFSGKIADGKLTGQLSSDRGSQDITGTKVVRRRGPRGG